MEAEQLLAEIGAYCRKAGLAETTFGRRAVNDGKLVSRLRFGGRITPTTLTRVRSFIDQHPASRPATGLLRTDMARMNAKTPASPAAHFLPTAPTSDAAAPDHQ